ncbi:MAG: hypothetical protein POELPBGB_00815 [Bacteroidia bacterium]|nr:hypothetical protein [Bacteroidia bacterium]
MDDKDIKLQIEQEKIAQEKLKLFKAQFTTNEQILDGLYLNNEKNGKLYNLEDYGFDLSKLSGNIIDGSSSLLTKEIFDNQIIVDYELVIDSSSHQPTYRIVKINFKQEYSKVFEKFKILLKQKKEIEGALWAYKFDSDMANPNSAKNYEQKKITIENKITDFMNEFDSLVNSLKNTLSYMERVKNELKK